jgi:peptidoglycan hydrolase CwlO-like protein
MTDTVIVAILALFGTLSGTFGGIMTSSKLTGYRIEQLESKVTALTESIKPIEKTVAVQGEQIEELKRKVG